MLVGWHNHNSTIVAHLYLYIFYFVITFFKLNRLKINKVKDVFVNLTIIINCIST